MDTPFDTRQHLNAVVHNEHLSVALHLQLDCLFDDVLVIHRDQFGLNRIAVGWGSGHDAQVTGSQQTELQCTRDRCRGERQHIDVRPQRFQFLFGRHTEFLFFINDEQTQIVPFDAFADQLVRANEDVYLTRFQIRQQLFDLLRGFEPANILNAHRHVGHALLKRVIVLQRQHGRRYEHGHLFAVRRHFERGTHRHFGLTESHIAAHQSVHRHRTLQVALHISCRFGLVGRVLVEERRFELVLHVPVRRVRKTFLLLAGRVETNKVPRDLFHLILGTLFESLPSARTQTGYRRLRTLTSFVFADAV